MDYHKKFRRGAFATGRWKKTPGRKQADYYEINGPDILYAPPPTDNNEDLGENTYMQTSFVIVGNYAYILAPYEVIDYI